MIFYFQKPICDSCTAVLYICDLTCRPADSIEASFRWSLSCTEPSPAPEYAPQTHKFSLLQVYDSVVTLALGLVTLTPSALALATISILFLEDTACAISAA